MPVPEGPPAPPPPGEITRRLRALREGDPEASAQLAAATHGELLRLARNLLRGERRGHTLEPGALVNEAWLRLIGPEQPDWRDRLHFLGIAARLMRQVLVDHARRRDAGKRGGDWRRVTLDERGTGGTVPLEADMFDLHRALERLEELDERQARVVELRFFGGLTVPEIGELLGAAESTIHADWALARAWLARELETA
jgi:RNA polymerase sigma factor (TIGR02999 family)